MTAEYVRSAGGEELTVIGPNGTPLYQNVSGAGKLLVTYDSQGTHYQVTDPLGTRRLQTDASAVPETDFQELPYGDALTSIPDPSGNGMAADSSPYHFTGKERDAESGNDYFGARYYASTMGRFLSPDWSAKEDPVPYAQLDDPQSLNLYSYVRNNPLSRTDPDGHCDSNGGNCSLWDHVAGAVGGVLNVVPATANLGIDAFNAVSSRLGGPQVDEMQMIQPDAHASMGGVQTGEVLQLALPAGDMSKGAQLLENAATGATGEAKVAEELVSEGKTILGSHVGVQTDQGLRVVDHLVQDGEKMGAVEVKTGGATRNASQLAKDASMESKGGKIVGKNAPANLRGQTVKLPTEVRKPQP